MNKRFINKTDVIKIDISKKRYIMKYAKTWFAKLTSYPVNANKHRFYKL